VFCLQKLVSASLGFLADASKIDLQALLREEKLPGRLLLIGMPLTIFFGAIIAAFLLKDITLAEAGLIGAMLSPTDAGLGQAIVNNTKVPEKLNKLIYKALIKANITMPSSDIVVHLLTRKLS